MASVDSTAGDRLRDRGGHPIGGDVTPSGNKNESAGAPRGGAPRAGGVVIENGRASDVTYLIEILRGARVRVDWFGEHAVEVDAGRLGESRPDAARPRKSGPPSSSRPAPRATVSRATRPAGTKWPPAGLDTKSARPSPLGANPHDLLSPRALGSLPGRRGVPRRGQCHGDGDRGDGGRRWPRGARGC